MFEEIKNLKNIISKRGFNLINLEETFKYSVPENYFLAKNHTAEKAGPALSRLFENKINLGFAN